METLDLQKFCPRADPRTELLAPFVLEGTRYATNGYVLVAVPAAGEPDSPRTHAGAKKMLEWMHTKAERLQAEWRPWPAFVAGTREKKCAACDGTGKASQECPDCEGEGNTDCPHCGNGDIQCERCKGKGVIGLGGPCEACTGTGKVQIEQEQQLPTGEWIDGKYFRLVEELGAATGGVEYASVKSDAPDGLGPIPLRFLGGLGLVMPMKMPKKEEDGVVDEEGQP
jgi:hypothetical protein